jgi:putative Holliday junction resolvase
VAIPATGRVLAVDWGEIRFGLAVSDETQTIASPLTTLTRRRGKRFPMPGFLELVTTHRPIGIVVGLPLAPDGSEGPAAAAARKLAVLLGGRTYLPVELVDELAATILLQHFLETRRHARG